MLERPAALRPSSIFFSTDVALHLTISFFPVVDFLRRTSHPVRWALHSFSTYIQTASLSIFDKNTTLLERRQLAANKPGKQDVKEKLVCAGGRKVNLKRNQHMHIVLLPLVWTHLISASSSTLKP